MGKKRKQAEKRLKQAEVDITMVGDRFSAFRNGQEQCNGDQEEFNLDLRNRVQLLEQAIGEVMKNQRLQSEFLRSTRSTLGRHIIRLERRAGIGEFDATDLPPGKVTYIQAPLQVENTPTAVLDLLQMVSIGYIPLAQVKLWDEEQLSWAAAWAMQQHMIASDNEFYDWELVPRPPHIDKDLYDGSDRDGPEFPDRLSAITPGGPGSPDREPGWR